MNVIILKLLVLIFASAGLGLALYSGKLFSTLCFAVGVICYTLSIILQIKEGRIK